MSRIQDLYSKYSKLDKSEFDVNKTKLFREDLVSIKENELVGVDEHKLFLDLLRLFRSIAPQFMQFIGTNFQETIKNLITVGASGMYSNELHFMDELIQNVDDCDYDNPLNAKLSVHCDWNHGIMVFEYNEKGFSPYNVYAITGIAEQAKNIDPNKIQIGEKGLGFKSVFGVANSVLIQSGYFSFRLNEEDFTCPISEYDSFEYVEGTRLTLFMEPKKVYNIFETFSNRYNSRDALLCKNPLLFLNKLSELRVYFDGFRSLKFTVERKINTSSIKGLEKAEHIKLSYEDGRDFSNELTCTHYIMPITYDREACVSRYGKDTAFQVKNMNMQVIIPDVDYIKEKNGVTKGAFYSFLPTQVEIPAPIVCHIPFKLDPSREHVDSQGGNKWFTHSCEVFSKMFEKVLMDVAETYKEDIVYYLPKHYEFLFNSEKKYSIFNLPQFKGEYFIKLPIFYTDTKGFLPAEQVYVIAEPEKVKSVKRIGEILNEKKQLFVSPDTSKVKGLKIDTISNLTDRLFNIALSNTDFSEEIFKILEEYEGFSFEDKIKDIQSIQLNCSQLNSIFRSNKCYEAFRKSAKETLKRAQRPEFIFDSSTLEIVDVRNIDESLHIEATDFGEVARRYFSWIRYECILLDEIPKGKYFVAQNTLLLSGKDTLSALSSFCHDLDPKDIFAATLELRNCSRELDLVDDSITAVEYMRKLRNVRKTIQTAFGKDVYNNYIKIINQAGTDPERYINELLQNADDCEYQQGVKPSFKLEISKDFKKIGTRYNEVGFTKSNVRAITAIGESTKKRLIAGEKDGNLIGEKGVGFKAVFAVANKVSIYSGDFCFELSADEPTIPKLIEKNDKFEKGTAMLFELKEKMKLDFFSEEKVLRLCLCLRKLKNIIIGDFHVNIKDEDGIRTISVNEKEYQFKVVSNLFVVDDEQALSERRLVQRGITKQQYIKFYVPIGNKMGTKYPHLYSGLPTEIETKIQLIIDAPFELDTARTNVIDNKWNSFIRKQLYESLKDLILSLRKEDGINVLRFINVKKENNIFTLDLFSNAKLNQTSFINDLKTLEIIPTWKENRYACPSKTNLYRIPKVLNYILENGGTLNEDLSNFVNVKEGKYDTILEALGVKVLQLEKVLNLLRSEYLKYLEEEAFVRVLYAYIDEHINSIYAVREMLKGYKIIPVKGKVENKTYFLSWNECSSSLYVKDSAHVSTESCWILETKLLKKDLLEKIFSVHVNELTNDIEDTVYRNKINDTIKNEQNVKNLYDFLMSEFRKNYKMLVKCKNDLVANKWRIPVKNQLGELKKGKVYVSEEELGYFEGYLLPSHISHNECKDFAKFIECKDISLVHYDELDISRQLTADDIEALQDEEILNGFEILGFCLKNNLISDELINCYSLSTLREREIDYDESIFNQPIKDLDRFKKKIQERIENPIRIVSKEVIQTIHVGVTKSNVEVSAENEERRRYVSSRYGLSSSYCVCQMCKKAKPLNYIEVNNVEKLPKFYWKECGVSLCLECSKRFEELREIKPIRERFQGSIMEANFLSDNPIEISIANETITFRQDHIAEIQAILKEQEKIN